MIKSLKTFATLALAGTALSLNSCGTPVGDGLAYGAGTGAIIGGLTGSGTNAAIGAAAGAAAGGLIGVAVAENQNAYYQRGYREPWSSYPVATATGRHGYVISPYAPYYEIYVKGVPHGALVRDPSCNRLFIRP
jgi:zinc transporter ZupT